MRCGIKDYKLETCEKELVISANLSTLFYGNKTRQETDSLGNE